VDNEHCVRQRTAAHYFSPSADPRLTLPALTKARGHDPVLLSRLMSGSLAEKIACVETYRRGTKRQGAQSWLQTRRMDHLQPPASAGGPPATPPSSPGHTASGSSLASTAICTTSFHRTSVMAAQSDGDATCGCSRVQCGWRQMPKSGAALSFVCVPLSIVGSHAAAAASMHPPRPVVGMQLRDK
jgi:hypothetical protein